MHEGENRFGSDPLNDIVLNEAGVPAEVGSFDMHAGKIVVRINPGVQIKLKGNAVEAAAVLPDSDDRLALGALSLLVHRSGERYRGAPEGQEQQIAARVRGSALVSD